MWSHSGMHLASRVYTCIVICGALVACGGDPTGGTLGDEDESADETATGTDGTDTEDEDTETTGQEAGEAGMEEETGGGATCGNGSIDTDEACDGENLGGQTCMDLGFPGGELVCAEDCSLDATGCTESICGNGVLEGDEECDEQDFGGVNCTDLGFGPGLPVCTNRCTLDTSTCPTLGEGDACSGFNPCENDLNCVSGTCYDGSPGDPCKTPNDCQSGDCEGATLFEDGVCM